MQSRLILWTGCLLAVLCLGCVSKAKFEAANSDYQRSQEQISEMSKQIDRLEHTLKTSETETQQCREEMESRIKACTNEKQVLSEEKNALSEEIKALNRESAKKEAVISLQETVIRLFDDSKQTLQTSIQQQIVAQDLETSDAIRPEKIVLVNKLLFSSGSADLNDEGQQLLEKLTGFLQEKQYTQIRILGHTDDQPFRGAAEHANNWELSAARATAVVRFLQERVGVPPERMSATGFGPYRPIASNDTAEGRLQNRRIEVILESQD